ncbi:MAG: hypothetical protein V7646_5409 [Pseudonocardia sp.]|jgi:hypothetical protein
MLKRSLLAVALLTGLGTPAVAQAATTSPSLAENVHLAWVDGKVKISWTERARIPNTIALEVAGKNDKQLGTTTADAPNQLIVPASALEPSHDPASTARIVISDPSTAEARSASFDRYIRGATSWAPMLDRGVLSWAFAPDQAVDTTPADPLDVDKPARFIPRLTLGTTAGECRQVQLSATTTPYGEIANQYQPFDVDMYAANEWGESRIAGQRVRTSATTFAAPGSTTFGAPITMSGVSSFRYLKESPAGSCQQATDDTAKGGIQVVLHGRNSATSAWYVVGATKTDAQGKYSFTVKNPGAREYRAVLTHSAAGGVAQYQSISGSKVVRATTKVVSAKFITPVITYGQKPNAYLWVDPAGSQQAALQFKNASGVWQGLMYKTLYAGRGLTGPFAFNRRGVTQFRWWVPGSTTTTGLKVDPVYSAPFNLTVL